VSAGGYNDDIIYDDPTYHDDLVSARDHHDRGGNHHDRAWYQHQYNLAYELYDHGFLDDPAEPRAVRVQRGGDGVRRRGADDPDHLPATP